MKHLYLMKLDGLDENRATYLSRDPSRDNHVQATLTIERSAYEEAGELSRIEVQIEEIR